MVPDIATIIAIVVSLTSIAISISVKIWIQRSLSHRFDRKIEEFRSELREKEEEIRSKLRIQESEISSIQETSLSISNQRTFYVEKRKIEAVDKIWIGFQEFIRLKYHVIIMSSLDIEKIDKNLSKNPKLVDFFQKMNSALPDIKKFGEIGKIGTEQRPFLSDIAWSYYESYQTVISSAYVESTVLSFGLEDAGKILKKEYVTDILKTALPHKAELVDQFGRMAYPHILEELEALFLQSLKDILDGHQADEAAVRRAKEVIEKVNLARSDQQTDQLDKHRLEQGLQL